MTAVRVNFCAGTKDIFQKVQLLWTQDEVIFIAHQADLRAVAQIGFDVEKAVDLNRPLLSEFRVLGLIIRKEQIIELVDESGIAGDPEVFVK